MKPVATFGYATTIRAKNEHPDLTANRYCLENIRKAAITLEPIQARARVKGVDARISRALNELKAAQIELEAALGDDHRRD